MSDAYIQSNQCFLYIRNNKNYQVAKTKVVSRGVQANTGTNLEMLRYGINPPRNLRKTKNVYFQIIELSN